MVDQQHCATCARRFDYRSKPCWAFSEDGRPAGRVHTQPKCSANLLTTRYAESAEHARFNIWLIYLYPRPPRDSEAFEAFLLADRPTETLSERQEKHLAWLAERGKNPRTPEQVWAIREAHTALIREYRAWKAALDAAPDGCALATGTEGV